MMKELLKLAAEKVLKKVVVKIKLRSGHCAQTLLGAHTLLYSDPFGKFITIEPQDDAYPMTRMIIIDTCGGWDAHGGDAFCSKVLPRFIRERIVPGGTSSASAASS